MQIGIMCYGLIGSNIALCSPTRIIFILSSSDKICGNLLANDWEADHVIPWSILPETNVHKMQATCKPCNRKKGNSIMEWRLHQQDMLGICDNILAGDKVSEILVSVTPGGGKSVLPVILAAKLIPTIADKICWIVPRDNLRSQHYAISFFSITWLSSRFSLVEGNCIMDFKLINSVRLELSNVCNLRCKGCPITKGTKSNLHHLPFRVV